MIRRRRKIGNSKRKRKVLLPGISTWRWWASIRTLFWSQTLLLAGPLSRVLAAKETMTKRWLLGKVRVNPPSLSESLEALVSLRSRISSSYRRMQRKSLEVPLLQIRINSRRERIRSTTVQWGCKRQVRTSAVLLITSSSVVAYSTPHPPRNRRNLIKI